MALVYFVFDLLRLDGQPLDHLPLDARKAKLRSLTEWQPMARVRYADHVVGQDGAFFDLARQRGLEGIISKRRDLPYHGGRHGGWVKTKCTLRQEFVIFRSRDCGAINRCWRSSGSRLVVQARGVEGQTRAFEDTDALGALDAIADDRPDVVLIERGFAESYCAA